MSDVGEFHCGGRFVCVRWFELDGTEMLPTCRYNDAGVIIKKLAMNSDLLTISVQAYYADHC